MMIENDYNDQIKTDKDPNKRSISPFLEYALDKNQIQRFNEQPVVVSR